MTGMTVSKIEFDPIEVNNGSFILTGRVTLANGEVRSISGSGMHDGADQEVRSQRILLRNVIHVLMGGEHG